jgi:succinyl-diaminopimelate desuccinylase
MTTAERASLIEALRKEPEFQKDYLVNVLTGLVAKKSVNPGIYEKEIAHHIVGILKDTCEVELVDEMMPGRPSVGAVLRGKGGGPRLVLNGHEDTVPVDDEALWSSDPFKAELRDGYLYGRGTCDMKGGLTCQIALAKYLARNADRLKGDLVLQFAAGEEYGEPGTLGLIKAGYVGDYAIVTEPTMIRVATAERGLAFYKIRIKGRSIHASRADFGINPVSRLRGVLGVTAEIDAEVRVPKHALIPSATLTPTMVHGGVKENAVADYCDLILDRRLLPGETVDGAMADIGARLTALKADDPDFDFEISKFPHFYESAEIDPSSSFAKEVTEVVEEVTGSPSEPYGTPYSSDVRNFVNDAGMEAITFGPGDVAECHCADERVSVQQLQDAALTIGVVACNLLLEA